MSNVLQLFSTKPELHVKVLNIQNAKHFHVSIQDKCSGYQGYGIDLDFKLAQTKALFELIERSVFFYSSSSMD